MTYDEQRLCESELEKQFHTILSQHNFPAFTQQHIFHPQRQWRFDFAFPKHKVAVEVQGYGPGHTSLPGMTNDYAKHNEALIHGWIIIYFMNQDFQPKNIPQTIQTTRKILELRIPGSVQLTSTASNETRGNFSSHIEAARRKLDQIINSKKGI